MTRLLPEHLGPVAAILKTVHGGFLRNTVREQSVTCPVCAAPILPQYTHCVPCDKHLRSGNSGADRVASLIYAVEPDSQAYRILRGYKSDKPGPSHRDIMTLLLALGLQGHVACCRGLAGAEDLAWSVVPSLKHPERPQVLREIVAGLATTTPEVRLLSAPGIEDRPNDHRIYKPTNYVVDTAAPSSPHVILIDDSWVSGVHANSAAAALKSVGVAQVSVLTVARVLQPSWEPNSEFISRELIHDFDPELCPWTGGTCP